MLICVHVYMDACVWLCIYVCLYDNALKNVYLNACFHKLFEPCFFSVITVCVYYILFSLGAAYSSQVVTSQLRLWETFLQNLTASSSCIAYDLFSVFLRHVQVETVIVMIKNFEALILIDCMIDCMLMNLFNYQQVADYNLAHHMSDKVEALMSKTWSECCLPTVAACLESKANVRVHVFRWTCTWACSLMCVWRCCLNTNYNAHVHGSLLYVRCYCVGFRHAPRRLLALATLVAWTASAAEAIRQVHRVASSHGLWRWCGDVVHWLSSL